MGSSCTKASLMYYATAIANGEAVSEHVRPCVQIAPGPLLTASIGTGGV